MLIHLISKKKNIYHSNHSKKKIDSIAVHTIYWRSMTITPNNSIIDFLYFAVYIHIEFPLNWIYSGVEMVMDYDVRTFLNWFIHLIWKTRVLIELKLSIIAHTGKKKRASVSSSGYLLYRTFFLRLVKWELLKIHCHFIPIKMLVPQS